MSPVISEFTNLNFEDALTKHGLADQRYCNYVSEDG